MGSSWIEGLRVSHRRLAEMIFDPRKGDELARSVVGNVQAMEAAVEIGSHNRKFRVADLLAMHRILLEATRDRRIAGKLRDQQVWIAAIPDEDEEELPDLRRRRVRRAS